MPPVAVLVGRLNAGSTIGARLAAGRSSGFDYQRHALAFGVIVSHAFSLTGAMFDPYVDDHGQGVVVRGLMLALVVAGKAIMPFFFGLSGFLVAGSLDRCRTLATFLGLRALRIVPALSVDTLFSALVLGPLLTVVPLGAYFGSRHFASYFANIVGDIHYFLPGVFLGNLNHQVNGQLWTIPFELYSYAILAALALIGIYRRRRLFLAATMALCVGYPCAAMLTPLHLPLVGFTLVASFVVGAAANLYRDRIPLNRPLLGIALALLAACLVAPPLYGFCPAPAVYVSISLGLLDPPRAAVIRTADYSYGLYLYGYPIQQAVIATLPFARTWFGNLLVAAPLICLMAAASWHLVETHALARRKTLQALETRWLARRTAVAAAAAASP